MPAQLSLKLITPARIVFEDTVEQVTLQTISGEITVLAHHTPLVSILKPGYIVVKKDGKERPLAIAGGIVEMYENTLAVLVDTAEHVDEIDLSRAEKRAHELSEQLKAETQLDMTTYNRLQYTLERDRARIETVKKWRR